MLKLKNNPAVFKGWLTILMLMAVCASTVLCSWLRIGGPAWIAIILFQIGIVAVAQAYIDEDL